MTRGTDGVLALQWGEANTLLTPVLSPACSTPSGSTAVDSNGDEGFSLAATQATLAAIADDTLRYQDGSVVLIATRVAGPVRQHEPHCGQFACP